MATVLGYLAIIFIISYLIPWILVRTWIRQKERCDEIYFIDTSDGLRLALYRYLPKQKVAGLEPVLLLHGMSASRYNFDFMPRASLADYLSKMGYDTFAVDFRGCGLSDKPGWSSEADNYNFDNYVDRDLPAFIKKIKSLTGSEMLHLIGHSLGGMSIYSYLGKNPGDSVRSATIIASPAKFETTGGESTYFSSLLGPIVSKMPLQHSRLWSLAALPYSFLYFKSAFNKLSNPNNWNLFEIYNFIYYTSSDFPRGLVNQTLDWIRAGYIHSRDHNINYTENIKNIETPAMVIAAGRDRLVPLESVRQTFDLLPEGNKQFLLIEKGYKFKFDYGHLDLVMSRQAGFEIFPEILNWLQQNKEK